MTRFIDKHNKISEFVEVNKQRFIWDIGIEALNFIYKLQYLNGEYMWKPDLSGKGNSKFNNIPINKIDKKGLIINLVCYFEDKKLYEKEFDLGVFK